MSRQTEPGDEKGEPSADVSCPAQRLLVAGTLVLFLTRIAPWLVSDLWYDEVITLGDFAIGPQGDGGILHVFRSYPVANNHVLFSAIAWLWVRFIHFSSAEYLLRLPSVLFGAMTIVVVVRSWSRWLGPRVAGLAGVAFAISPVFTAFAYQLRGYSLSMFLGALATTAVMEAATGEYRRCVMTYVPVALLLPLVVPTNIVIVLGHLLFLFWCCGERRIGLRLARCAPIAAALACGSAYYLTIWPQFRRAVDQTVGWSSAWLVLGNLILGFAAHLGPFILASMAGFLSGQPASNACTDADLRVRAAAWRLMLCVLVAIAAFLVAVPTPPFPRTFLVCFPTLSFCVLCLGRDSAVWQRQPFLVVAGLVVFHGFLWEACCTGLTRSQVGDGRFPQNLVQQYYRGSTALSAISHGVAADGTGARFVVVAGAHDFPALRHYWGLVGLPPELVTAENRPERLDVWRNAPAAAVRAAVACNEVEATRLFSAVEAAAPFKLAAWRGERGLYVLE